MEKSRVEISTNYSLSIYCTSGSRTHIISLNLRKNYARHMCPHRVAEKTEIQIGQVTKGSRGAGWQSWSLAYALPAPAASVVAAGALTLCRDARMDQPTPCFYC